MGNVLKKKKKEISVLMIGLDNAGKTTMWYQLTIGKVVPTIRTTGFNVEQGVTYKDFSFTIWDVAGVKHLRPLWKHYYPNQQAIIFVVDSSDHKRLDDSNGCEYNAKKELMLVLSEKTLKDAFLLIFANKQDLPNALSVLEVAEHMELFNLQNRHWFIQGSCIHTGEGIYEGLDWLCNAIKGETDANVHYLLPLQKLRKITWLQFSSIILFFRYNQKLGSLVNSVFPLLTQISKFAGFSQEEICKAQERWSLQNFVDLQFFNQQANIKLPKEVIATPTATTTTTTTTIFKNKNKNIKKNKK